MDNKVRQFISHMDTLSDTEREKVMSALLNGYCVACGAKGDWSKETCLCEPHVHREKESPQLWLTYYTCDKAAE